VNTTEFGTMRGPRNSAEFGTMSGVNSAEFGTNTPNEAVEARLHSFATPVTR
jgi:hypothetical protein